MAILDRIELLEKRMETREVSHHEEFTALRQKIAAQLEPTGRERA